MAHSTISLEAQGQILQPSQDNLFHLADSGAVWVVIEGKIDLFVCARAANGDLGARHHFLRVEKGHAVFSVDFHDPDTALIATGLASTRLLRISQDTLQQLLAAGGEQACALLEEWIMALAARFCSRRFPLSFVDAASDSLIVLTEQTRAVVATAGIKWVRHRSGFSVPLGDSRLSTINGQGYFPVSRFGWLQAAPESELQAISTADLQQHDTAWQGLRTFHEFIEQLLSIERNETLDGDQNRLRQRSSLDASLLENALRRLSAPIHQERIRNADERNCNHPVFQALQAVASEMGILLTPPAEMLQSLDVRDPVGTIAKTSSIRIRKVALKGVWYKRLNTPLLCFVEQDQRPVAVIARSSSSVEVYDPSTRTHSRLTDEFASELNPIAYTMYRPFPSRPLHGGDLLKFGLARCKSELLLIGLTGLAGGVLAVVNPYVTGIIFDRLIPGAERDQLLETSVLLLAVAIAGSMFMFVRGFATIRLQGKMDAEVQAAVWDRLLGLPVSFFRDYTSGDLAQRSMGISQIREILTGSALNAVLSGIFSIFSFALLFFYSVKLALVATGLVLFAFTVSLAGGLLQLRARRNVLEIAGDLSSKLLQFVGGIAKFKVSGSEGRAFAAWAREFSRQKENSIEVRKISNLLLVFNAVFPTLATILIFYVNARPIVAGELNQLSTGEFLAFLAAFAQFLAAALTLSGTLINALSVVPIYERTKPILRTPQESSYAKSVPGILGGEIEISHVSFAYRADTPLVLRDMTLRISAGQAVAFVGSSGCGKSTLLRLLLGFERPASGTLYYDGQDLAGLDIQAVRRQIGVVLQTSRPISGSIFDNIVGSAPLTMDDAWEACRLAGLEEDVKRMPMGLHTVISDGGGGISGGQRQRLMIARAIVAKPRILLFDEATSALDNHTQAIVSRSLAGLQATRVVIAHRLSTVVHMDKIFVLDKGSVAESGTYAELMERRGQFYELAKRQLA